MAHTSKDINVRVTTELVGEIKKDGVIMYAGEYWDVQAVNPQWRFGTTKTESVKLIVHLRRDKDEEETDGDNPG